MLRKIISCLLALAAVLSLGTTALAVEGEETVSGTFADVQEEDWYYEAVEFVYSQGLMDGVDGGNFDPEGSMSRAMVATVLWRISGEPEVEYDLPFEDVPDWAWYAPAVRWAASRGIVNGISDTEFAPDTAVNREQMAAMLHRYAVTPVVDEDLTGFSDYEEVSSWALEAMRWAVDQGIVTGIGANQLSPKGRATRCQAAAMFMRFLGDAVG